MKEGGAKNLQLSSIALPLSCAALRAHENDEIGRLGFVKVHTEGGVENDEDFGMLFNFLNLGSVFCFLFLQSRGLASRLCCLFGPSSMYIARIRNVSSSNEVFLKSYTALVVWARWDYLWKASMVMVWVREGQCLKTLVSGPWSRQAILVRPRCMMPPQPFMPMHSARSVLKPLHRLFPQAPRFLISAKLNFWILPLELGSVASTARERHMRPRTNTIKACRG